MRNRNPATFRPSPLVAQLLQAEAERTGKPKGQIINDAIAAVLGQKDVLLHLASIGRVPPNVLGEIAARASHHSEMRAKVNSSKEKENLKIVKRVRANKTPHSA